MAKTPDSSEVALVSCDVCDKEIPQSEAVIPEAVDYVVYFCGLECYSQWQKQSGHTGQQGEKPRK